MTISTMTMILLSGAIIITLLILNAFRYGKYRSTRLENPLKKSLKSNWLLSIIFLLLPYFAPISLIYFIINKIKYNDSELNHNDKSIIKFIVINTIAAIIYSIVFIYTIFYSSPSIGHAVSRNDISSTINLIEQKVNINETDAHGKTPLHIAAWHGNVEIGKLLIKNGAKIEAKNSIQETPLHVAAWKGNIDFVKLLVENNADIYSENNINQTPCELAIDENHIDVVNYFLQNGFKINTEMSNYENMLLFSAAKGKLDVVKLLENKISINYKDMFGRTALHYATINNQVNIVKYLLDKNVNRRIKDVQNKTPLDIAKTKGYVKIIELLK